MIGAELTLKHKYRGKWWRPSNRDVAKDGELIYDVTKGIHLHTFGKVEPKNSSTQAEVNIIWGTTETGYPVTLLGTRRISTVFHVPNPEPSCTYRTDYAILGIHIENASNHFISSLSFCISYLEEWIGKSLFDHQFREKPERIIINKPTSDTYQLNETKELEIFYGYVSRGGQYKLDYKQQNVVTFSYLQPVDLDEAIGDIKQFRRFLELCCARICYPTEIFCDQESLDFRIAILKHFSGIDTYRGSGFDRYQSLITYEKIKDFTEAYNRWSIVYSAYASTVSMFFGNLYSKKSQIAYQFVAACFALESYHRNKTGECRIVNEDRWNAYKDQIENSLPRNIPTELLQSVKSSIEYSNDISFRTRLKELLKRFCLLNISQGSRDSIANAIVATRNEIVHGLEKQKDSVCRADYPLFLDFLTAHVQACLLSEIVGDDNVAHDCVSTQEWFPVVIRDVSCYSSGKKTTN